MGLCASSPAAIDAAARTSLDDVLMLLRAAYGKETRQTGYTDGHTCIGDSDRNAASEAGASLLYGEVLPEGVLKLLDEHHLNAASARSLVDLGMGTGKLLLQAFLTYPNLSRVTGVEISASRFGIASRALAALAASQGWILEEDTTGRAIRARVPAGWTVAAGAKHARASALAASAAAAAGPGGGDTWADGASGTGKAARERVLEMRSGDMWKGVPGIAVADIVIMHTDLTEASMSHLRRLVNRLKLGTRFLTYQDLVPHWRRDTPPFQQLAVNIGEADTFLTSWSSSKGYHLYCWEKHEEADTSFAVDDDLERKEAV